MLFSPLGPKQSTEYLKILRDLVKLPGNNFYQPLRFEGGFQTDFCFPIAVMSYQTMKTTSKLTVCIGDSFDL